MCPLGRLPVPNTTRCRSNIKIALLGRHALDSCSWKLLHRIVDHAESIGDGLRLRNSDLTQQTLFFQLKNARFCICWVRSDFRSLRSSPIDSAWSTIRCSNFQEHESGAWRPSNAVFMFGLRCVHLVDSRCLWHWSRPRWRHRNWLWAHPLSSSWWLSNWFVMTAAKTSQNKSKKRPSPTFWSCVAAVSTLSSKTYAIDNRKCPATYPYDFYWNPFSRWT